MHHRARQQCQRSSVVGSPSGASAKLCTAIYYSSGSGHKRGHSSLTTLIYLNFLRPYSPLRRECRTASAEPVCSCAFLCALCARDRGCSVHPVFPAPSDWRVRNFLANLGRIKPRECGAVSRNILSGLHPSRRGEDAAPQDEVHSLRRRSCTLDGEERGDFLCVSNDEAVGCSWLFENRNGKFPSSRTSERSERDPGPKTTMSVLREAGAADLATTDIGGYGSRRSPGRRERVLPRAQNTLRTAQLTQTSPLTLPSP